MSGAGAVATGLTYLTGVVSAGSAIVTWVCLLFAQTLADQFTNSFGSSRSGAGLGDEGVDLALSTLLLIGIAALCFVGAARFSALGRSGLAYAGTICVLISLLIGSVGSGGGGWSLLLAPVPIGALIALLASRVKPGDPAR